MADGFRGKPGEGSISAAPLKKSLLWVVVGGIGLTLLIVLAFSFKKSRSENSSGSIFELKVPVPQAQSTLLIINQTEWKGIPSVNPQKRTEFTLLTPNVVMLVRLNGDNQKVYSFYFAEEKIPSHRELPESNYMEFRVKPGQSIPTASVIVAIVDRRM